MICQVHRHQQQHWLHWLHHFCAKQWFPKCWHQQNPLHTITWSNWCAKHICIPDINNIPAYYTYCIHIVFEANILLLAPTTLSTIINQSMQVVCQVHYTILLSPTTLTTNVASLCANDFQSPTLLLASTKPAA